MLPVMIEQRSDVVVSTGSPAPDLSSGQAEAALSTMSTVAPLGRLGTPEDVASVVRLLSAMSPRA